MDVKETHDMGRFYWLGDTRDRSWKPVQISRSLMQEPPYRRGLGAFFSLPGLRHGVAVGWWGRSEAPRTTAAFGVDDLQKMPVGFRDMGDMTEEVRGWYVDPPLTPPSPAGWEWSHVRKAGE